jgi:hypothetical protein
MSEMNFLIVAVVAVGAGILLIKFGQVIARFLLVLGGLIVAAIIGLAFLEQARATRAVATTASIAATGQAATSASLAVIVVLVLFFLATAGGVAAYLYFRRRGRSRWLPGPNAYWGQTGAAQSPYAYWGQTGAVPGPAGYPLPAPPGIPYPYPPVYYIPPQPVVPSYPFPYSPDPAYPYPAALPEESDETLALPWWE